MKDTQPLVHLDGAKRLARRWEPSNQWFWGVEGDLRAQGEHCARLAVWAKDLMVASILDGHLELDEIKDEQTVACVCVHFASMIALSTAPLDFDYFRPEQADLEALRRMSRRVLAWACPQDTVFEPPDSKIDVIDTKKSPNSFDAVCQRWNPTRGGDSLFRKLYAPVGKHGELNYSLIAEVLALTRLRGCPGVIQLTAFTHDNGWSREREVHSLWMPCGCDAISLSQRDRFVKLGVRGFAQQLCAAVLAIHRRGVFHCDLKLGNIVFLDGNLVLVDFGSAAMYPEGDIEEAIATGEALPPLRLGITCSLMSRPPPSSRDGLWCAQKLDAYSAGASIAAFASDEKRYPGTCLKEKQWHAFVEAGGVTEVGFDEDVARRLGDLGCDFVRQLMVLDEDERGTVESLANHPYLTAH